MISASSAAGSAYSDHAGDSTLQDEQSALLALMIQGQASNQCNARDTIELDYQKLEELKAQIAGALAAAARANRDSGTWGFVSDVLGSDVAQVAGAVAMAAAVIATGGAAAPLVLLTLSAGLETGAKLGAELGLDPKLCMAIGLAGAALGFCAGNTAALGEAASTARTVQAVATTVQGAAMVGSGVAHGVAGGYAARAQDQRADATLLGAYQTDTELDIDQAIALLDQSLRTESHMTGSAARNGQDDARANLALIANI